MRTALPVFLAACLLTSAVAADQKVQLAADPNLSPDGKSLLYAHNGDIFKVATQGGRAVKLTSHFANDSQPHYSPDGKSIAFISNRTGSQQVFVMNAAGGEPTQLTFHTEGFSLHDWYPDGKHLLVSGNRDHFWKSSSRFMKISATERSTEKVLFNDYGDEGKVSPDGNRILFVREGERWWRKGYTGSRSAQIWLFDTTDNSFTKVVDTPAGDRSPVWAADGEHFFYCSSDGAKNGARNLWQFDLQSKTPKQITHFEDDLVATPTISADGKTIVFAHLFDLYHLSLNKKSTPTEIKIRTRTDDLQSDEHRRTLTTASDAAFSSDGLEVALIAGGDLWVMETVLKEPVQITSTSEFESDPLFIHDDNAIVFVGWKDGQADIWKAERTNPDKYWWQNSEFQLTQLTDDAELESNLQLSPNGQDLAYVRGRGDLWIRNFKTSVATQLVDSFSSPSFDFSPDGKWLVYSNQDDNFNYDIWIAPIDKSSAAVNVSRHPDNEYGPKWSSDGKIIAFSGRRNEDETDIHYLYLAEADDDTGSRDLSLKKTIEAFEKARKKPARPAVDPKAAAKSANDQPAGTKEPETKASAQNSVADKDAAEEKSEKDKANDTSPKLPEVHIDFHDIHRRLRTISNSNSSERVLGWTPDGKTLLFTGTVKSESGTYSVTFPSSLTPKKITTSSGSIKGWLKSPDRILWLVNGIPSVQALSGAGTGYTFNAYQQLSKSDRFRAGFETAWRVMRDSWYDENFGNHNWDKVRRKYVGAAATAIDESSFSTVISLMLGELNGSHLGFYPRSSLSPKTEGLDDWTPTTVHLGVRFDDNFKGPGLKVKDVIPDGPAEDEDSIIKPDEIILSIDGTPVDPDFDLTKVLNGNSRRDVILQVKAIDEAGTERKVTIRPTSYAAVRSALYQKWQDDNRALVSATASNIGYLHIQGMNQASFLEFERELYDVGYGKDALIIDVRDNGGGSTADHLLTALTQPDHAITVPRGGGPGYPHDRRVYATWNKPILVMCNQNSYSNAEIFSHAIKNLGRGKLVGVATAGGVISTGSATVMDVGTVRLPFRGWFVKDTGEDMELNGAVPDFIVWPEPNELPNGTDRQLSKAIEVLKEEIEAWKAIPKPELRKATER
ncbi:MAG: S41 family peptidase [Fuerstiella sp.]